STSGYQAMNAAVAAQVSAATRPPTQGPAERRAVGSASTVLDGDRMVAVAIEECGVVDIALPLVNWRVHPRHSERGERPRSPANERQEAVRRCIAQRDTLIVSAYRAKRSIPVIRRSFVRPGIRRPRAPDAAGAMPWPNSRHPRRSWWRRPWYLCPA